MPFDKLDVWLQERADQDEFSGAVLVQRDSQTIFTGADGPASRRWPVPNTMATRFDIASRTKLFTGVAALQLGTPYREHIREAVFAPAAMDSSDGAQVAAGDMVSFLQAVRAGRLLTPELTEAFLTPQVQHHDWDGLSVWYGFGAEFVRDAQARSAATSRTASTPARQADHPEVGASGF